MENTAEFGSAEASNNTDLTSKSDGVVESDFYAQADNQQSAKNVEVDDAFGFDALDDHFCGNTKPDMPEPSSRESNNHSDQIQPPIQPEPGRRFQPDVGKQQVKRRKPPKFLCTICTKGFTDNGNLVQHMRIHTGERPFECKHCHKRFAQQSNLNSHEKLHTGKTHECKYCHKLFAKTSNLHSHEARHTGEGNYKCDHCGKAFFFMFELRKHLRNHAGSDREKPFPCDQCNKSFDRRSYLGAHIRAMHSIKSETNSPVKAEDLTCPVCQKSFKWRVELDNHKKTHSKLFECLQCKKVFENATVLRLHMRTHGDFKPFACDICTKSFTLRSTLWQHKNTHLMSFPFQCSESYCRKSFKTKHQLNRHMVVHSDDKGFVCDICSKSFSRKSNLIAHRNVHISNEDRPFRCRVCGKGCFFESELRVHERSHTGEKPYSCETCGKKFSQKGNLSLHQDQHSSKKKYKCEIKGCYRMYKYKADLMKHEKDKHAADDELLWRLKQNPTWKLQQDTEEDEEKEYRCEDCGMEFRKGNGYKNHNCKSKTLSEVQKPKPFGCDKCHKKFAKSHELQKHRQHHAETYKCTHCPVKFLTDLLRKEHERTHKRFVCSTCSQVFKAAVDLDEHMKSHMKSHPAKKVDKKHECSVCSQVFSGAPNLKMHEARVHGLSPFRCKLCVEGFQRASQLKEHEEKHLKDSPHRCRRCSETFLTEPELDDHSEIHTKSKPKKCEECGKLFKLKDFPQHECQKSGDLSFICSLCEEAFAAGDELENHMSEHMGEEAYTCSMCQQEFSQISTLCMHEKTEHGLNPYPCSVCDERFSTITEHQAHYETHQRLECQFCGEVFLTNHALQVHESAHQEDGLKCPYCSCDFQTVNDLNYHVESCSSQMEEDAPEEDGDADDVFAAEDAVTEDEKLQTCKPKGINPYKCPKCGMRFHLLSALKRHHAAEHSNENNGPQKKKIIGNHSATKNDKSATGKKPNVPTKGASKTMQPKSGRAASSMQARKGKGKPTKISIKFISKPVAKINAMVPAKTSGGRGRPRKTSEAEGVIEGKKQTQSVAKSKNAKNVSSPQTGRGRGRPKKTTSAADKAPPSNENHNSHQELSKQGPKMTPFKCHHCDLRFASASKKMQHEQTHM